MKLFTTLIILLIVTACQKGELKIPVAKPCAVTSQHNIISVSGPVTAHVGQQVNFMISWAALNGCDKFVKFNADTISNIISIKAYASHDSCTTCTTFETFKTSNYQFSAPETGKWCLKFYHLGKDTASAITDTLIVK